MGVSKVCYRKANGLLLISTVLMAVFSFPATVDSQEPVEAAERTIERKQFPWFDSESSEFAEVKRKDPGQANSLNRGNLARRIAKSNPAQAPNFNAWNWLPNLSGVVWVLISILFLLIVAALVWMFLRMESRAGASIALEEEEEAATRRRIRELPFDLQQTPQGDLREQALRFAQQGDFKRATMLLFSHVLIHLDRKELIQLKKGKTNRQYLQELKPHSGVASFYRRVMVPFEDTFFGEHSIGQDVFDSFWNDLELFHQSVDESQQVTLP